MASLRTQRTLLFLLVASLCIIQIESSGDVEEELETGGLGRESGREQREFDFFTLALLWPGTCCRGKNRCCPSNACCSHSHSLNQFTIHGLWADYNDGTWPACCNGPSFDTKEISPLRDPLEKYWPSLSCESPSTCHGGKGTFWGHEWEKHGTCASSVVRDEYGYFMTALNLYFKYNVTQVLNEAGYVPSNSEKYPLGGIISAIQNAFHATPELQCKGGAVEELRLCFYKDFMPRDCITEPHIESFMVSSKSSCPKYISLPIQVSSDQLMSRTPMNNCYAGYVDLGRISALQGAAPMMLDYMLYNENGILPMSTGLCAMLNRKTETPLQNFPGCGDNPTPGFKKVRGLVLGKSAKFMRPSDRVQQ